jgi:hypothetical protein
MFIVTANPPPAYYITDAGIKSAVHPFPTKPGPTSARRPAEQYIGAKKGIIICAGETIAVSGSS